jgi:hypothetical protein
MYVLILLQYVPFLRNIGLFIKPTRPYILEEDILERSMLIRLFSRIKTIQSLCECVLYLISQDYIHHFRSKAREILLSQVLLVFLLRTIPCNNLVFRPKF